MDQAAEDDAERARNRARLYAPPKGRGRRGPVPGVTMNRAKAAQMVAQLAAEDARLGG
ncbi:hypothetical protein [Streptomyces sp. NBC_01207]|uniref:hypothetical protein n=1 Tax=Streptomyces sp. NBC_01207 TaxID=2903772 RepID=UPI002E114D11|nr:hypothetical protein OG457_27530 [Streptomyces sp. NBC_01207]